MADFVFNIAKGRVNHYATQVGVGNAALVIVPVEATGIEADATLKDHDDLSSLLAGASTEQTGVGRKTVTVATVAVDDSGEAQSADMADVTWTAPAAGNAVGKVLVCFDPDTAAGTDAGLVPLTAHDVTWTPDTNDFTVQWNAAGFFKAS